MVINIDGIFTMHAENFVPAIRPSMHFEVGAIWGNAQTIAFKQCKHDPISKDAQITRKSDLRIRNPHL